jgi:hypothetical protein
MPEAKLGDEESEESSSSNSSEDDDSDDEEEEQEEEEDKGSDNEKIDVKGKHRKEFGKKKKGGFEKRITVGPSGIAKKHKEEYNKVKDRKWIIRKKER